jgi:hypothetical protein
MNGKKQMPKAILKLKTEITILEHIEKQMPKLMENIRKEEDQEKKSKQVKNYNMLQKRIDDIDDVREKFIIRVGEYETRMLKKKEHNRRKNKLARQARRKQRR